MRFSILTPRAPGAVAIVRIAGLRSPVVGLLDEITDRRDWADAELSRPRLCRIAGLDDGLVALMNDPRDASALITLHGGVALVDAVADRLRDAGFKGGYPRGVGPEAYPEAIAPIDADALIAIAESVAPMAVPFFAGQPAAWRRWYTHEHPHGKRPSAACTFLDHLRTPPTVVLIGRPNVGKSTLLNALAQREAAITAPIAGTTRDYLSAESHLAIPGVPHPFNALAVRWLDTPGLRDADDTIEHRAIDAARRVIGQADVVIALRDPEQDFPDPADLPVRPDLYALNKADLPHASPAPDAFPISARSGAGLDELATAILARLGLPDFTQPDRAAPVPFCVSLRGGLADRRFDWPAYLGLDAAND